MFFLVHLVFSRSIIDFLLLNPLFTFVSLILISRAFNSNKLVNLVYYTSLISVIVINSILIEMTKKVIINTISQILTFLFSFFIDQRLKKTFFQNFFLNYLLFYISNMILIHLDIFYYHGYLNNFLYYTLLFSLLTFPLAIFNSQK